MPSHVLSRVGAHLPAITSRQPSLQNPLPRAKNVWSLGSAFFVGTHPRQQQSHSLLLEPCCPMAYLAALRMDATWPPCGLPKFLHLDNAKEFHARALLRGCEKHGIEIIHRPPLKPHCGGHIERLIGTLMGEVHLLSGTTFSSTAKRGTSTASHSSGPWPKLHILVSASGLASVNLNPGYIRHTDSPSGFPSST
jgi:hypothetical protein